RSQPGVSPTTSSPPSTTVTIWSAATSTASPPATGLFSPSTNAPARSLSPRYHHHQRLLLRRDIPMPSPTRKRRGSETQTAVAQWFAANGWPYAEPTGAGRTGPDITGIPGLACEVKARRGLDLPRWLRQAATGAGLPFVVHRPDGMGPAVIGSWPVTMRLEDFTGL